MMKMTGLSHLSKWENLQNWWLTKYFFAPLYMLGPKKKKKKREKKGVYATKRSVETVPSVSLRASGNP